MQDQGPYSEEPPPTEAEIAAARALATALDGTEEPSRGSLAELARAARASARAEPPLAAAIVARGIDDGLARQRAAQRRVALVSFAAAAVALVGFVALARPFTAHDALDPDPSRASIPSPALSPLPRAPFPEGQRSSDRVDRMARLASTDWLAEQVARAREAGAQ